MAENKHRLRGSPAIPRRPAHDRPHGRWPRPCATKADAAWRIRGPRARSRRIMLPPRVTGEAENYGSSGLPMLRCSKAHPALPDTASSQPLAPILLGSGVSVTTGHGDCATGISQARPMGWAWQGPGTGVTVLAEGCLSAPVRPHAMPAPVVEAVPTGAPWFVPPVRVGGIIPWTYSGGKQAYETQNTLDDRIGVAHGFCLLVSGGSPLRAGSERPAQGVTFLPGPALRPALRWRDS